MPFVSDLLTATPATVEGNPTPTRTWQWLRGSTPISGATSNTYTVQEADIGETISVRQTETNIAGTASATSAATTAIEPLPATTVLTRAGDTIVDRAGNNIILREAA